MKCEKPRRCRNSVLVIALSLSLTGIAFAESTHQTSQCHLSQECFFTIVESFCKALAEDTSGVQFSVGP